MEHLVLGGEDFTTEFQREISCQLGVAHITHLYGPTEATIDALALRSKDTNPGCASRSVVRCPITGFIYWTEVCSLFRRG